MNKTQIIEGVSGRTAVVTGAAQGIGRSIADTLVQNGARTAYLDLNSPKSFAESSEQKFFQCDITKIESIEDAFNEIENVFGTVELLVNNAGIFKILPIEETSIDIWNQMLSINLTGAFLCSKRALPGMKNNGYGRIVSIGSSAGKTGGSKDTAAYGVSKAGVHALAKAIATEYAPYGITSNALAPALINTDMVKGIADLADRIH